MTAEELKPIICPHCKGEQPCSMWLAAHWRESLIATCQKCGKKFGLKRGFTWKEKP
jgi:RNase P subunit RPR2